MPIPPGVVWQVARGWACAGHGRLPRRKLRCLPQNLASARGAERLAAGLAGNLVVLDAATLPGMGVGHGAMAVSAANALR
jgi:hypothetical protein